MSSDYTTAEVTYFSPTGGRTTRTFPATSAVVENGVLRLLADDRITLVPMNDLVASVELQ